MIVLSGIASIEIYALSLHDALPIWPITAAALIERPTSWAIQILGTRTMPVARSEEHTSELQSLRHLVCSLLLEKPNGVTVCLLVVPLPTPPPQLAIRRRPARAAPRS